MCAGCGQGWGYLYPWLTDLQEVFFNSVLRDRGTARSRSTLGPEVRDKTLRLVSGPEAVRVSLSGGVKGGGCVVHERGT